MTGVSIASSKDTVLTQRPVAPQLNQSAVETPVTASRVAEDIRPRVCIMFSKLVLFGTLEWTRTSAALRLVPLGERLRRPGSLMKPDKCAPALRRRRMQDGITRRLSGSM